MRLVYLMNDAVESFLVFSGARMTGHYQKDYEGELDATLSQEDGEYVLVVYHGETVVTIFFQDLLLELPDNRYSSAEENVPVLQVSVLYHLLPLLQDIHIYHSESPDGIPESADTHTLSPRNVPHLRNYRDSSPAKDPGRNASGVSDE